MDFLLDYGYVLVVMNYFCDVMGFGCSEMLFVCLRLWRMGRWARAILTDRFPTAAETARNIEPPTS
jgi:hypothetical protein